MISRCSIFIALLFAMMIPVAAVAQREPPPRGWKRVTSCSFTFLLPSRLASTQTHPVDSCLAAFESTDLSVSLDFGLYSSPLSKRDYMKDHQEVMIKIGSRDARLITYREERHGRKADKDMMTEAHIVIDSGPAWENALLFTISSQKVVSAETIRQIYQSIRYVGKKSN